MKQLNQAKHHYACLSEADKIQFIVWLAHGAPPDYTENKGCLPANQTKQPVPRLELKREQEMERRAKVKQIEDRWNYLLRLKDDLWKIPPYPHHIYTDNDLLDYFKEKGMGKACVELEQILKEQEQICLRDMPALDRLNLEAQWNKAHGEDRSETK